MTENAQQVYTIIAMTKRFSSFDRIDVLDPTTYQVMITRNGQEPLWVTMGRRSWEGFTLGETVIFVGKSLWHEGLYPTFPIVVEVSEVA